MGMAASQARYLALTARKTNTEYEGQQINQARTALANQSANLFNRLLNMEVPNPPKTSDYTTLQYSYSDGENESVIDDWKQLSGVNPDYNYLVKSHYYTSMYTGAIKQLSDPQVQISGNGQSLSPWSTIELNKRLLDAADDSQKTAYNQLQQTKTKENSDILRIQTDAQINNAGKSLVDSHIDRYAGNQEAGYYSYVLSNSTTGENFNIKYFNQPENIATAANSADAQTILQGVQDMLDTNIMDLNTLNRYLINTGIVIEDADISKITENLPQAPGGEYNNIQTAILNNFALETDSGIARVVNMSDINAIISDDTDGDGITAHTHTLRGTYLSNGADPTLKSYADEIRDNHVANIVRDETAYNTAYRRYQDLLDNYQNNITKPTYIGNSELTPLVDLSDDQKTELLQVVKDMKADNIKTDIINCFDEGDNYLGGVYSFKMNGITYYTTQNNLEEAYYNSYPQNGSNNIIDGQYKMPYYNASYINQKIEKESYALLETDGNGRFKSVKFDDNSVVYSLNTETVTDEAAYEDAMNRYIYEKEKYEKTIADINAKTSIIQKEDRTLELRLKQLETEQLALKTEMDAVKKVIKDNVESTFKTFSD